MLPLRNCNEKKLNCLRLSIKSVEQNQRKRISVTIVCSWFEHGIDDSSRGSISFEKADVPILVQGALTKSAWIYFRTYPYRSLLEFCPSTNAVWQCIGQTLCEKISNNSIWDRSIGAGFSGQFYFNSKYTFTLKWERRFSVAFEFILFNFIFI